MLNCRLLIFFPKSTVSNPSFTNTIIVSNSFDPDQARTVLGPDLGPKRLQSLSADDTSRAIAYVVTLCLTVHLFHLETHRLTAWVLLVVC